MIRKCAAILVVLTFVLIVRCPVFAQNPHTPKGNYRSLSYGEWAATWWQTVLSIPVVDGDHPLISGGAFDGPNGMLFLAGAFAGEEPAVIEITIRPGTPIFFPVINSECSVFEPDPFHGDTPEELHDCANFHIDNTSGRFATINGKPVKKLDSYRVESPLFEWGPLPADNIFGAPTGTTSPAADAGVYLLLPPLKPGVHVIDFGGTFDLFGVSINTRYVITVDPKLK